MLSGLGTCPVRSEVAVRRGGRHAPRPRRRRPTTHGLRRRTRAVAVAPAPPPPPPLAAPPRGRPRRPASPTRPQEQFETLKRHIHTRLVDRLDMNRVSEMDPKTLRNEIRGVVEHLCDTENPLLNRNERQRLVNEILDETFGFGPLELLLKDDKIGDIMINGPKKIYVEKEGRIQRSEVVFRDNEHLLQIIDRIVSRVGRRVDETSPMVDARLPERLAVQRDHPAAGPRRPRGHDPDVRLQAALQGRPAPLQGVHARDARADGRGDEGPAERHHLGRHRLGQDDAAEHALQLHPARPPRDHDRGRRRAPAPAGPRRAAGDPPGQHRGPGRRHGDRPGEERPAYAARPDHHRRVPRRRDARHDPGHEHRPRRLDDHRPRQHARATP